MKRIKPLILILIFGLLLFGCSKKEVTSDSTDSDVAEDEFSFGSMSEGSFLLTDGSGWASMLKVDEKGGVVGEYLESDMSASGVDYDGTVKSCSFYGQLDELEKIDEYTYSTRFTSLVTKSKENEEYIEDSIKHINVEPKGIIKDETITIHLPKTDTSQLDSDFVNWIKSGYYFEGKELPIICIETTVNSQVYGWAYQL